MIAQELDEDGNVTREWDDTPADFGRIAAQTAKQVILQRIREAEREMKYEEYAGREGDIVTGIIQQTDARYTLLDLGRVEALLPQAEQVPGDRYDHGARMKAYIVEVRKTAKGPQIVVSRTHPGLVKRLFELEVPELLDGVVEIKAVAREPGHRTKLAVASNDQNVDPVGACVGARGMRVRQVVNELRGEKVDIVPYSDDPPEFVMRALAPAKVREVRIHEDTGIAEVIVPDFQLSLAIGKEGQNARLAARLTGWRVDIKSETQLAEEESGGGYAEGEWVEGPDGELMWQPAGGGEAISAADAGYAIGAGATVESEAETPRTPSTSTNARRPRPKRQRCTSTRPSTMSPPTSSPPTPTSTPKTRRARRRRSGDRRDRQETRAERPGRTCVGCRRQPRRTPEIRVGCGSRPVPTERCGSAETAPGRGAWVCSKGCFEQALRTAGDRGALARALRRKITSTEAAALRATTRQRAIAEERTAFWPRRRSGSTSWHESSASTTPSSSSFRTSSRSG